MAIDRWKEIPVIQEDKERGEGKVEGHAEPDDDISCRRKILRVCYSPLYAAAVTHSLALMRLNGLHQSRMIVKESGPLKKGCC